MTSFAIPFAFIPGNGASVTQVYLITYDSQGVATETLQTLGTSQDYYLDPPYNSATGIDNVNVIFNTAPPVNTQTLVIRQMSLTQMTSFLNSGPTFLKSIENVADVATFLIQQLQEQITRTPKFRLSGTDDNVALPDVPTNSSVMLWSFDVDGKVKFLSPSDVSFQAAFSDQLPFSVPMNSASQILTGYSFDGAKYSSVVIEYEVQQGTTVFTNGAFQLQCRNGTWQKVDRSQYDNGTPMGVTFGIQQTSTVVQLLANETGVGDAVVKLRKMYFLAA
jgi:hypothetical protein